MFDSNRDGNQGEIYSMNPDGSGITRLTSTNDREEAPAWSPDGTKIVYHRYTPYGNLFVMNADGSGQHQITFGDYDYYPDWSPDGSTIVFSSIGDPQGWELYTVSADGSHRTPLTDTPEESEETATFSPDGSKIAYTRDGAIWVMNADGSGLRQLTTGGDDHSPAWSPDGREIAFASGRQGQHWDIWVTAAGGGEERQLTDDPSYEGNPTWSPDGCRIAFNSDRDDNREIYVMNADGSGETRLTHDPESFASPTDQDPDWQPGPGSACLQGPLPGGGAPGTSRDTIAPRLHLRVARRQRVVRQRGIRLVVRLEEAGQVRATARIVRRRTRRIRFTPRTRRMNAGERARIGVRLGRRGRRVLARRLAEGGRWVAKVRVTAVDRAGNATTAIRYVRIRR